MGNRLGAVADAKLGQHVAHVVRGGLATDVQPRCDFGVTEAQAHQVQDLPFALGEFARLAPGALMFFPDPAAALREMRRVARPTGTVAVLVPGALTANRPYELFVDIVTRHAGGSARNLVTTYFAHGDRDQLVRLFTEAGLHVTTETSVVGESRFGSIDELVNIEIDSSPLGEWLDPSKREQIQADSRDSLAPWRIEDGSLRFPFECNVVVARP